MLRIPKRTCLHVLHKDIGFRKYYLRWIPHSITANNVRYRVTFSEEFLQVVRDAKETKVEQLLTGDES
jgi:hypothetical protein